MPAQPSYRIERINESIRRELVLLFKTQTKDPRLQCVNITDVLTSKDLSVAKVFYSTPATQKSIVKPLLDKAGGFFRTRLSKSLELRHTPALQFVFDTAPNTGARIDELLSKL